MRTSLTFGLMLTKVRISVPTIWLLTKCRIYTLEQVLHLTLHHIYCLGRLLRHQKLQTTIPQTLEPMNLYACVLI